MKKACAILLSLSIFLSACAGPAGAAEPAGAGGTTGSAEPAGSAGTAADPEHANVSQDAEQPESQNEKPDLVLMRQEKQDYSRAAQNKKNTAGDQKASTLYANTDAPKVSPKNYTIMVYIVGSNLESRYGAATNDIKEMIGAGLDFGRNNLLVYTGGAKRWVSDISNAYNSVIDLGGNDDLQVMAKTQETADMGTPETLAEFINYCTANYPAKHYGLILWDHGAGPLWGYGSDELFENDSLLLEELQSAMDKTQFGPDSKLDWVGFDACLMGCIENAKLWKDYARYLVGSEELEPGRGWDYSFLKVLNETDDGERIVSAVVDAYGKYYEENRTDLFNPDVTLSALDLSQTEEMTRATDRLFGAMKKGIENGEYASLNKARRGTKAFGVSVAESKEEAFDLLDLRELADNLKVQYLSECEAIYTALDQMVVASTANIDHAGGLSIYLPGDNRKLYAVSGELYRQGDDASEPYQDFVDAYMDAWTEGNETDWTLGEIRQNSDELVLQLSEEQVRNASAITYTFLYRDSDGAFTPTTCEVTVEPDLNNIVHIPADPMLLTAGTDMEELSAPLYCFQTEKTGEERSYRSHLLDLVPGHEYGETDYSSFEPAVITAKNRDGDEETTILDITYPVESAGAGGKGSVDVSNYESIGIASFSLSPVRDEEGRMMPYGKWTSAGNVEYSFMCFDKSFRIEMKHASEFDLDYNCQIVVTDVNGNSHATEYIDVELPERKEKVEVPTQKGTLYASISEEEATIIGYSGEDEEIIIPDTVRGKPVKRIGNSAFEGGETVQSIVLPDTVTEIGDRAFYKKSLNKIRLSVNLSSIGVYAFRQSGLHEIELPDSLKVIKRGAFFNTPLASVTIPSGIEKIGLIPFGSCKWLKEIVLDGENSNYKTVDGVLYTKDGKELIQYPGAKEGEYIVEEGTESIAYGAFASAALRKVEFPSTLLRIGNMAFENCLDLGDLQFPESLESIGHAAFGHNVAIKSDSHHPWTDVVRIGPNVNFIGYSAFGGAETPAFEVDERNPYFASAEGFITSKAGDMIIAVPRELGKVVRIPDGVTTLPDFQFAFYWNYVTDFVIPDSTFRFGDYVFPFRRVVRNDESVVVYQPTIHCSEGSAAEKYARLYDISYDYITDSQYYEEIEEEMELLPERSGDSAGSADGSGYETDRTGKFTFRVYDDHAELLRVETNDSGTLRIPSEFRGLPVTALARGNDSSSNASIACSENVVIPESVENIDAEFFTVFKKAVKFEVEDGNENYSSKDGVIFTKDGKTLAAYPRFRKDKQYTVPDRTKNIGDSAFYNCSEFESVVFPSSLQTVGVSAFYGCSNLTTAKFNEGLKEIERFAFSGTSLQNIELPSSVTMIGNNAFEVHGGKIELPEKLRMLGNTAFTIGYPYEDTIEQDTLRIPRNLEITCPFLRGILVHDYEVDDKNPYHAAVDGMLMSKDQRTLIAVPAGREGAVYIPDGTEYIGEDAFYDCHKITDIYLPDTILSIGKIGIRVYNYDSGKNEYKYVIHCRKGTEAQKILSAMGIPWVEI